MTCDDEPKTFSPSSTPPLHLSINQTNKVCVQGMQYTQLTRHRQQQQQPFPPFIYFFPLVGIRMDGIAKVSQVVVEEANKIKN